MHDIRWIRDNPDAFDAALKRRGLEPLSKLLIALDEKRRAAILASEQTLARRNAVSKDIGDAKKNKDNARADALMAEVGELKTKLPELEAAAKKFEDELKQELAQIPNLPLAEVPDGADEHGNVAHHHFGARRDYAFKPKEHIELGEAMKFMDFEAAAKMSGARFVILKKGIARLERAIGQFMLDLHTNEHGYTEVNPPLLVRDDAMFGTAQLPKFRDDQFAAGAMGSGGEGYWLIPTAEVPLTNLVRESILDEKELPMRLTALTPCFRAEAGAAGRDTRGMIRQHQFTKVELVSITTPEESKNEHERMLACAEEVLRRLDLHYRVMTLCTGDMGFASQKTYDIEVWMPGQGEGGMYREISSCSVCGDFQARRMDARSRGPDGKPRFVHTLNGSGTAVGRALIAVMETYQQDEGSIAVPDVLQPYMGGLKVIGREGESKTTIDHGVDIHLRGTGAILMNLQALEFHLRWFLLRLNGQEAVFPKQGDKTVKETYLTNYMQLSRLIKEYNSSLTSDERAKFVVDESVVDIRDAIAHGRLTTNSRQFPSKLWKFDEPKDGIVPIKSEELLTQERLREAYLLIYNQKEKVLNCFKQRAYEGLR